MSRRIHVLFIVVSTGAYDVYGSMTSMSTCMGIRIVLVPPGLRSLYSLSSYSCTVRYLWDKLIPGELRELPVARLKSFAPDSFCMDWGRA